MDIYDGMFQSHYDESLASTAVVYIFCIFIIVFYAYLLKANPVVHVYSI